MRCSTGPCNNRRGRPAAVLLSGSVAGQSPPVAWVRILVDGFSLLHNWPELAAGRARHSVTARDALVQQLTAYSDATGVPVTVVFDGRSQPDEPSAESATPGIEVLYTRSGQTADQVIERLAVLFRPYGEVLAITDDHAERDTVLAAGGAVSDCRSFICRLQGELEEMSAGVKSHNRRERGRFRMSRG